MNTSWLLLQVRSKVLVRRKSVPLKLKPTAPWLVVRYFLHKIQFLLTHKVHTEDIPRFFTVLQYFRIHLLKDGSIIHLFFSGIIFLEQWLAIFLFASVSAIFVSSVKFEIRRKWVFVDGMLFPVIRVPKSEVAFLKETVVRWLLYWPEMIVD